MQEFTVFVASHSLVQIVFVMEIPFGAFKHLIHVHMNVFSAGPFDESEETCTGSTLVLEAPPAGLLLHP